MRDFIDTILEFRFKDAFASMRDIDNATWKQRTDEILLYSMISTVISFLSIAMSALVIFGKIGSTSH